MSTLKSSNLKVLREQRFTDAELLGYAASLSDKGGPLTERLLHWEFGPLMTMRFSSDASNYLFSDEAVPFHWDGAFHREPRQLLFYCTDSEGAGGETLFTNTELLWESLTESHRAQCAQVTITYETEKKAHYGGSITVPLVQRHPVTGHPILRAAEEVETTLNPVKLSINGVSDPAGFFQELRNLLYDSRFLVEHQWRTGDLVVCDNFTYLHGRRPLGTNLTRSFKRIQIL